MIEAHQIEAVKRGIAYLFKNQPQIHVNIRMKNPRIQIQSADAEIKEIYSNFFIISEINSGIERKHTLSYTDILLGEVEILELNRK